MDVTQCTFTNADQEVVPYDGSPIVWRISAYAYVIKDGRLLIAKNSREKLCDIVGGGIEMGETIQEALQREAVEEAGATISVGKLLDVYQDWFYHHEAGFCQTIQLFYMAEIIGELSKPTDERTEWTKFVSLDEIGTKYRLPSDVEKILQEKIR